MAKVSWFQKLNVDNIRIKGLPRRPSKRLMPPAGRGLCTNISPRSLPAMPVPYIKLCTDSSATNLMPTIWKLVNTDSHNCFPAGGCQNSVLHVLKPKSSKQQLSVHKHGGLLQCKDEIVETPHPSSPTRPHPAAGQPAAANAQDAFSLGGSRAVTNHRSSFSKSGAEKCQYISNNRPHINENCPINHKVAEKKVVLTKQSRSHSTASGRSSSTRRKFKQKNSIQDRYNVAEDDSEFSSVGKSSLSGAKNKALDESKSKPKVKFERASTMRADIAVPAPLLSSADHNESGLPYSTTTMPTDPYFEGYSSTSSSTSDDNMFSSFEQGLVTHSSHSSSTEKLHELMGVQESQSQQPRPTNTQLSTSKSKFQKSSRFSETAMKGVVILSPDKLHQHMTNPKPQTGVGAQANKVTNNMMVLDDAKRKATISYQRPSTQHGLQVGCFEMVNAKDTAISHESTYGQLALHVDRFEKTNETATAKTNSEHEFKGTVKLLQATTDGPLANDFHSGISASNILNSTSAGDGSWLDAEKTNLLLKLGGVAAPVIGGEMDSAGRNKTAKGSNWRTYSSRRGGAAGAALRKKAQLLQARWELTEAPLVWADSGDDDTSSVSTLTSASCHQPNHSIFAKSGNSQLAAAAAASAGASSSTYTLKQSRLASSNGDTTGVGDDVQSEGMGHTSKSCVNNAENTLEAKATAAVEGHELTRKDFMTGNSYVTTQTSLTPDHPVHAGVEDQSSLAVVKCSRDPFVDFRDSMMEMMVEKQITSAPDMEELLQCFLALNKPEHHPTIIHAFTHVWKHTFQGSDMTDIKSPISSCCLSPWKGLSPNYYTM